MTYREGFLEKISARRTQLRSDVERVLPNPPRPIVWEIGCGHGHFLVRYAAEHPTKHCIGVDLRLDRLERSDRKRDRAKLGNCHFLRTEAREFLHALPADIEFEEIWVLFPDPWPKARHNKHRLLKPEFFNAIARRAPMGARFYFRTDHAEYFQEVAGFFQRGEILTWKLSPESPWPMDPDTVFQARAPEFRSLIAVRTGCPAPAAQPVAPGLPPPAAPTSPA